MLHTLWLDIFASIERVFEDRSKSRLFILQSPVELEDRLRFFKHQPIENIFLTPLDLPDLTNLPGILNGSDLKRIQDPLKPIDFQKPSGFVPGLKIKLKGE